MTFGDGFLLFFCLMSQHSSKIGQNGSRWPGTGAKVSVFEPLLDSFSVAGKQNIVKYCVFMFSTYRNDILQHAENCVNTINTVIFATRCQKNTVVLGFQGAKNIGIYRLFCFEDVKNMRKHDLFESI